MPVKQSYFARLKKDLRKYRMAYALAIPVIIYYILFHYKPMYGILIAFKDFSPGAGIWGSPWTKNYGMQHFIDFFSSYYFWRLIRNTLRISLMSLFIGFPAPIIFALLLNEIKNEKFKKLTQTISYLPHFISMVVMAGLIRLFVAQDGPIVDFLAIFGFERISLLTIPKYYPWIHVLSGVWQGLGWSSIIYIAALAGVDPQLYEAARMDGANRFHQMIYVTLPGITPTIVIMLLMQLGSLMSVGSDKILLLYDGLIYETADVISTFVYRKGILEFQYSYSTAVGIFNSIINFTIVFVFNRISRKVTEISLW